MQAIVVDHTSEVSLRACAILPSIGVHVDLVDSIQELARAIGSGRPYQLLIANLTTAPSLWELSRHLRRAAFRGRALLFLDYVDHPAVAHLSRFPGAHCLPRPPSAVLIDRLLKRFAQEASVVEPQVLSLRAESPPNPYGIVGNSPMMREIFSRIEKVAAGDANVCIYGESGTGKELIARAIHYGSARRDRPLITLDCAAIPEGLMESHLFGHVKGSFTGALDHREGVFSLAHTGTLFIDELGELSPPLQAKLLRVLQSREFFKVGSARPSQTDIRIITATNRNLEKEVKNGTFREDLYYRVAVVMIRVPPLRERREDIALLVDHFVQKFAALHRKPIRGISRSAMDRIVALPWPGNVRQLENVVEQAFVLSDGDTLTDRDLFSREEPRHDGGEMPLPAYEPGLALREVERRHILNTLSAVRGNRTEAAKLLDISLRGLQYKLKAYALESNLRAAAPKRTY